MARLLLLIAALFGIWYWLSQYRQCAADKQRWFVYKTLFWLLLIAIVALAASGRMHWIAAVITAAIPVLKSLFSVLIRLLPILGLRSAKSTKNNGSSQMTETEAWQILGLSPDANRQQIITQHKQLIQKLHPDRGGNEYLAARINNAKDLLLKNR